jgi:Tfp pilus assembly protein PilZ
VTRDREHQRYAHEASATFVVAGGPQVGKTVNVSRGGLCAALARPLAVGTDLDVELVLVFEDDARSDALRLPVRVVWCTPVDDLHQVGLAFRGLSTEQTEYLGTFLRFLDDGAREPRADKNAQIDDRFG